MYISIQTMLGMLSSIYFTRIIQMLVRNCIQAKPAHHSKVFISSMRLKCSNFDYKGIPSPL